MTSRGNERALQRRQAAREELRARQQRQIEVIDAFGQATEELDNARQRAHADAAVDRLLADLEEARRRARQFKTKLSPEQAQANLADVAAEAIAAFGTAAAAADVLGISPREVTRLAGQRAGTKKPEAATDTGSVVAQPSQTGATGSVAAEGDGTAPVPGHPEPGADRPDAVSA